MPDIGTAIGLSDRNTSYVPQILTTMRDADKEIVADMKAKRAQSAQHKKDMEKYDSELQNFTLTADSGLWDGYHKDIQTHAAKIKDYVDKKRAESPDWNPRADSELNKLVFNMKSDADIYRQATTRMNTDMTKLQQLHPEDYQLNKDLSDIIASGDKDKLLAYQQKQAQGTNLEHLVNPKGLYYGGLYQLNDKPTTFLPILESDAGKLGQDLVKVNTLSDGTKVRISTATPEQIKAGFQSFALTNKAYQKFRNNSIISGETNPATGQPFKDANEVDNYFADRYAASVKKSYANIPADQSAGAQAAKNYSFSEPAPINIESDPYRQKGLGKQKDYLQVTLTKTKGGKLPVDTYKNLQGQNISGFSTGEFLKDNSGKVVMEVAVPNKTLTTSKEWQSMDNDQREQWLSDQYAEDPNKFNVENVPLDVDFNKNKVKTAFGKGPDEMFGNSSNTSNSYKIKGKSYTHSELNKLGYTDEQISAAQKAGTIK